MASSAARMTVNPSTATSWPRRGPLSNGEWRDQELSEDEYMARFGEADDRYAAMLAALIAELK